MKLLFVAGQLQCGGAERHLVALAGGLARRGHHVALACMKAGEGLAADGVKRRYCCDARDGIDLRALGRLAALIDAETPDLLVATSHYSLMCCALAAMRCARRPALVFICHSMGVVQRGARARLRFMVYRRFYASAACVVFVSECQRQFFATLGILPRRAQVVHNGIDLAHFAPQLEGAAGLRARHGFGPGDFVVGLCAAFREEKRQDDLLHAVARLRARGLPYRAILVGEGAWRPQLEACLDRLGLADSALLAGLQTDVRPYVAMCDAMALTSHSETFPISTLEYMALGKSVVASDVGGMREQFVHGHNGLLYRPGDVDALAAELARLRDPALRARLERSALRTVRNRFNLDRMLDRYETLFGQLATS
ncbi:MAG: glycosyltransferase family 4 protein [Pseudomonadota bacterium]